MSSLSLTPTISKPTRITDNSYSLIDNIFCMNQNFFKTGILTFDISDHFPIFIIYQNVFQNVSLIETIQYRLINERTVNNLIDKLHDVSFDDIIQSDDLDTSIKKLDDIILSNFNICCPIKTKKITAKDKLKPWVSGPLKILIKKKQIYYQLYKRELINENYYKNFKNFVTYQLRIAKRYYYENLLQRVRNDIRKT